jgi:hypothetical protein
VLSPSSARSEICDWEVEKAARLNKRVLPVNCRPLEGESPPPRLRELNYIFFYEEPKLPGSGFGTGLASLIAALNTDFDWLREHTRYLQRAIEWDRGGRPANRLLSGDDIADAKAWVAVGRRVRPSPTALQLDFIRASEEEAVAVRRCGSRPTWRSCRSFCRSRTLNPALHRSLGCLTIDWGALRITMRARLLWLTAIGLALSACSIQRGQIANDAQAKMIGLSKEQVLACMGPPVNKDTGGATEVWSYNSGKGGNCNVKVTIKDDHVSAVDYSGLTGGLLSPNEQCAYAVEKCATKQ